MKTIFELLIELTGGIVLLFSIGQLIAHWGSYDSYYEQMMYDANEPSVVYEPADRYEQLLFDISEQVKL